MSGSCVNHSSYQTEAEIMGITYFLLPPPEIVMFWVDIGNSDPRGFLGGIAGVPCCVLFSGFKEMLNISHDEWGSRGVGSVSIHLSVIIPVSRRLLSK